MTLEIDTPDGVKSGSSVIGVRRSNPPDVVELGLALRHLVIGGPLYPARYYGDAPFVDLGGGRMRSCCSARGSIGIRRRSSFSDP